MRVRVVKLATIHRSTQTTYEPDLTAPLHTGPSRKPPASRWGRLWARVLAVLRLRRAPVPQLVEEGHEGTLVEFRGFEGEGEARRVVYNPFPVSVDACVDYDRPVVLLLDSEHVGDRPRIWFSSPVSMVYSESEGAGLPVRFETRSSSYALIWLDKPAVLPEDDGKVRG